MFKQKKKYFIIFIFYILFYIYLSLNGTYLLKVSGKHNGPSPLRLVDEEVWFPLYSIYYVSIDFDGNKKYNFSHIDVFYFPLIILDRLLIHKTKQIYSEDFFKI